MMNEKPDDCLEDDEEMMFGDVQSEQVDESFVIPSKDKDYQMSFLFK